MLFLFFSVSVPVQYGFANISSIVVSFNISRARPLLV